MLVESLNSFRPTSKRRANAHYDAAHYDAAVPTICRRQAAAVAGGSAAIQVFALDTDNGGGPRPAVGEHVASNARSRAFGKAVIGATLLAFVAACSGSNFQGAANKAPANTPGPSGSPQDRNGDPIGNGNGATGGTNGGATGGSPTGGVNDKKVAQTNAPDGSGTDGFFPSNGNDGGAAGGGPSFDAANVKVPRFAMLVNNLKCGMCHLKISGNVASTAAVTADAWTPSHIPIADEEITGSWYAASTWTNVTANSATDAAGTNGEQYPVKVIGGVTQNDKTNNMPLNPTTKQPAYPTIDFIGAAARMTGTLTGADASGHAVTVNGQASDNVVLIGTDAAPITVKGSVMVHGDLVIAGRYKGLGSIYVTGRVYIPADLTAMTTAFPFPDDPGQALTQGMKQVAAQQGDALGIASNNSIFIADLDTCLYNNGTGPCESAEVPLNLTRDALGVEAVYSWFPTGKAGYMALYQPSIDCKTGAVSSTLGRHSFNRIDAYLYAANAVAGISIGSWQVRGGIIANYMHILGEVSGDLGLGGKNPPCAPLTSPVTGKPMDHNYIDYDYRMQAGMRILGELAPFFQ